METQNQIKRTLSQPRAIDYILNVFDATDKIKGTELADKVCEEFGFFDQRGKKQRTAGVREAREVCITENIKKAGKENPETP